MSAVQMSGRITPPLGRYQHHQRCQAEPVRQFVYWFCCIALKKIELRKNDKGEVRVKAIATGYPENIDWGEETAQVHKQMGGGPPNFMVTFSLPKAKEALIVNPTNNSGKPFAGGSVWVELFTTFKDNRQPEFVRQIMQTPQK